LDLRRWEGEREGKEGKEDEGVKRREGGERKGKGVKKKGEGKEEKKEGERKRGREREMVSHFLVQSDAIVSQ